MCACCCLAVSPCLYMYCCCGDAIPAQDGNRQTWSTQNYIASQCQLTPNSIAVPSKKLSFTTTRIREARHALGIAIVHESCYLLSPALSNGHFDFNTRINVDGSDLTDDFRGGVQIDDALVDAQLKTIPGVSTFTAW